LRRYNDNVNLLHETRVWLFSECLLPPQDADTRIPTDMRHEELLAGLEIAAATDVCVSRVIFPEFQALPGVLTGATKVTATFLFCAIP